MRGSMIENCSSAADVAEAPLSIVVLTTVSLARLCYAIDGYCTVCVSFFSPTNILVQYSRALLHEQAGS